MEQDIIQILNRTEVLVGLHDDDIREIASLPSIRFETFDEGEVISREGEPAEEIYILVEGKVHLKLRVHFDLDAKNKEITVDTVSKGSVFGWSALVQPYSYSRTSVCAEKSKVLVINGKELIELMDSDEHIGYEVMRSIACVVSSRLRTPNNYYWSEFLKARNGI